MNGCADASLRVALFDYALPPELIAQSPAEPRDSSRLLVMPRTGGAISHHRFADLAAFLRPGDLLVANRSRVIPARFAAHRPGGRSAELLLLRRLAAGRWEALVRPGRKIPLGATLTLDGGVAVSVTGRAEGGTRIVEVQGNGSDPDAALLRHGIIPLPPYIRGWDGPDDRYQTIYADVPGSVAAPTAGLHFTPPLLEKLQGLGVDWRVITLHVGLDTFRPVQSDEVAEHVMHREHVDVPDDVIAQVARTRSEGGRVIAVGTTVVRALESAARHGNGGGWSGWTDLFITPGYEFRAIDGLVTNFHLPRSTLLMLVSAFAGRERVLMAYADAVAQRYRFFSFGDAMLIL